MRGERMTPKGPLGNYGIAKSLVQTPGWKPLEAAGPLEQALGRGGGGGGFSLRGGGGGEYRGRIGADTTNLPPSQRGLYENSAPSKEAIQSAYNANLENGMTHQEIMKLFNDQADRDKKFWAEGFAKDPNFSQTLYDNSQKMLGTNQAAKQLAYERATKKNKYGQTVNDQLRASAGAFNEPFKAKGYGPWTGSTVKAAAPKATKTVWGKSPGNPFR
jgi:hypothetical protein